MLKSYLFLGLVFFVGCSDDSSIERQDTTRDNNGGIIITFDMGDDGTQVVDPNCGNGMLDDGESCDDGNLSGDDYCAADCKEITGSCGDGVVQANEVCDGDDCTADCNSVRVTNCGNGELDAGEVCDDGNLAEGDYCAIDCSEITGMCGDDTLQANEVCDDGNRVDGDYCNQDCSEVTGTCGDDITQDNEVCDDGNRVAGDYCDALCVSITGSCGDGIVQNNENCDDQITNDCINTHDGGDASCVSINTCSPGYMLGGNGVCISTNTTGLFTPCSQGAGFSMFKIHYDSGSTSARVDVWDANCNYSFASNSACNVREVCRGFCDVARTGGGNPIFNTSSYWRVRFNANGFNFTNATLWVQARGTQGSTVFRAWSPLYGDATSGLVNGFSYDWYSVDWTNYISPLDQPSVTAIQIYGMNGPIAVQGVELCVQ